MLSCLQSFRSSPVNAGTFHEISHRGRTSTLLFEISVSVCLVEEQLTSYFENKNAVQADFFFFLLHKPEKGICCLLLDN